MQIAVSGTYVDGKVILDEAPPINNTEPSEVMVVFLTKSTDANTVEPIVLQHESNLLLSESQSATGFKSMSELGGILAPFVTKPVSEQDIKDAIAAGIMRNS
jgi:hypothetical protein